ncbi:hypothetical protein P0W64_12120 [Tsukamurella sp. 8F]|uniref:hypothetical protein n=1 Tax=unclassified Tsukamurella TaxID=2633480 RepID=UPI0023BA12A4|nr:MULTISPECIES: hypothetical protein [unclassified Tsukamurella]MDF0532049.1 hypothetical protein [Tsukamurella sp. 8J]MDF0587520.1 hypothetical protein [Tsukamurella sp. 8F]
MSAPVIAVENARRSPSLLSEGVEFIDVRTGLRCVVDTPRRRPELWRAYLDGVDQAYRAWGVDEAFEREQVADGRSTTLFCVVVDGGEGDGGKVVAGHRTQGPYLAAAQSHALIEWAGQAGQRLVADAIEDRLSGGLAEVKSAYVEVHDARAGAVANLLSRVLPIVMELVGVRYMMATAADHVLARWSEGGGVLDDTVPATPYPDDRYRTRLMFWDRERLAVDAAPDVWPLMEDDFRRAFGAGNKHSTDAITM